MNITHLSVLKAFYLPLCHSAAVRPVLESGGGSKGAQRQTGVCARLTAAMRAGLQSG